jgi:hypothetical protein
VACGVREVLEARGLIADTTEQDGSWTFRRPGLLLTVMPLPAARRTLALFHPRALLVLAGEGPQAEALKSAIRLKFLRVGG